MSAPLREYRNGAGCQGRGPHCGGPIERVSSNHPYGLFYTSGIVNQIALNTEPVNVQEGTGEKWPHHWYSYFRLSIRCQLGRAAIMRCRAGGLGVSALFNRRAVLCTKTGKLPQRSVYPVTDSGSPENDYEVL